MSVLLRQVLCRAPQSMAAIPLAIKFPSCSNHSRLLLLFLVSLTAFGLSGERKVEAQLATSFYNITEIRTRVLSNAVQTTIRTDGTIIFGGDLSEFINFDDGNFAPKAVTAFRLRLLNARSRLPAFVDIGAYPIDFAALTLGAEEFVTPYMGSGASAQATPRVDIQLRFFVPVTVQRFNVDTSRTIVFGNTLDPREVAVELGQDRRSIIITVIPDRVDAGGAARLRRSPAAKHNHRLVVTPANMVATDAAPVGVAPVGVAPVPAASTDAAPDGVAPAIGDRTEGLLTGTRIRVDVLHSPLDAVLDAVSSVTRIPLAAQTHAADVDVSLLLPAATPAEFLNAIATGYGLVVAPRAVEEGGGFAIDRAVPAPAALRTQGTRAQVGPGSLAVLERLPLRHLAPEQARLLFPDFLLPVLRIDKENNALLVSASPEIAERLRRDLAKLDLPRPQVRVETTAWEFASTDDADLALRSALSHNGNSLSVSTNTGELSISLNGNQQRAFSTTVEALASKGRARLAAKPFIVVASGGEGTLFLGQARYVTVLRQRGNEQFAEALRLSIGYSLTVTPQVGAEDDITLRLRPRVSTVDTTEAGSGLPTLGIRETDSVVRVRPGDSVIVAGLDSDLDFSTRRSGPLARIPVLGRLFGTRRKNRTQTTLILLVTARRV